MSKLEAEVMSISYRVEIPDAGVFLKISDGTELDEKLMRAGAYRIEANGHYGSAYFFSLNAEDSPKLDEILSIIEQHIKDS